ncbi:MAG TPA: RNA-binding protein [Anaerolineae bacterium]|nr:RNA-binding protein [Anaerolineae bacterium]
MQNKLYVGNLPYDTTDDELRQIFEEAGEVQSATIITDRDTGRSKGFGFVEMSTEAEAQAAIHMLNGRMVRERPMRVDIARPRTSGGGGGSRRRGFRDRNRYF